MLNNYMYDKYYIKAESFGYINYNNIIALSLYFCVDWLKNMFENEERTNIENLGELI
jgi:hypothetical protein